MSEIKELVEFLEEEIEDNEIRISLSDAHDEVDKAAKRVPMFKEIKGILEQRFGLRDICRWWIDRYPEDVFPSGWIAEVREYFQAILNGKCTISEQKPWPPDDLVEKIINIVKENLQSECYEFKTGMAATEIRKLLGRGAPKLIITNAELISLWDKLATSENPLPDLAEAFKAKGFHIPKGFNASDK